MLKTRPSVGILISIKGTPRSSAPSDRADTDLYFSSQMNRDLGNYYNGGTGCESQVHSFCAITFGLETGGRPSCRLGTTNGTEDNRCSDEVHSSNNENSSVKINAAVASLQPFRSLVGRTSRKNSTTNNEMDTTLFQLDSNLANLRPEDLRTFIALSPLKTVHFLPSLLLDLALAPRLDIFRKK